VAIRLPLVDDDRFLLEELRILLSQDFEIAGVVSDGEQMIAATESLQPDVILAHITTLGRHRGQPQDSQPSPGGPDRATDNAPRTGVCSAGLGGGSARLCLADL